MLWKTEIKRKKWHTLDTIDEWEIHQKADCHDINGSIERKFPLEPKRIWDFQGKCFDNNFVFVVFWLRGVNVPESCGTIQLVLCEARHLQGFVVERRPYEENDLNRLDPEKNSITFDLFQVK